MMIGDPSAFGYQEGPVGQAPEAGQAQAPGAPGGQVLPSQYKFSAEEMRVLGECNRDSFVQRSLPLGTVFGMGTLLAVQKGHLKPNPRFGPFPKVTLAVMVGYFIGKLSYQQRCAEKLMALPGSYIGQLLRERRDGKIGGTSLPKQSPGMFGATSGDIYSDAGPGSSLDLDTDRPLFNDDTYRPDANNQNKNVPESVPKSPSHSYDELRRKNRGEHPETKRDPYRLDPGPGVMPAISRARPVPHPSIPTNQYGDVME